MSFYNTTCCLRRIGNKNKIADRIISEFPVDFTHLISLFYGSGSLENRLIGKVRQITANDFDNEVYNLYQVMTTRYAELEDAIEMMPYHESLFKELKNTDYRDNPVMKAARFLVLSNWSYLGTNDMLRFKCGNNSKRLTLRNLKANYKTIMNCNIQFMCCDFRQVLDKIGFYGDRPNKQQSFIYADPPYFATSNTYNTPKWIEADFDDLLSVCCESECRFAISEFDNPVIKQKAIDRGLNVLHIRERQSLKNRNTEILITNYQRQDLWSS
jgi:DNA adenine methylase